MPINYILCGITALFLFELPLSRLKVLLKSVSTTSREFISIFSIEVYVGLVDEDEDVGNK